MARRIIILAVEVENEFEEEQDALTDEELAGGIQARLDEFFVTTSTGAGPEDYATWDIVPESIRCAVVEPDGAQALWMAASVGLDGADDALDPLDAEHAFDALGILDGSVTA